MEQNSPNSEKNGLKAKPILTEPFDILMQKITELPFWIKEVIMKSIEENISLTPEEDIYAKRVPIFPLIVPEFTFMGKNELKTQSMRLSKDVYKFLKQVTYGKNLTQITLSCFWSLEKTAHCFSVCYEKELIKPINDSTIGAVAAFIGNEIKLGEYLKRIGIVEIEDIMAAVKKQKEEQEKGKDVSIGSIFTRMGLIKDTDIAHIVAMKEGANKIFVLPLIDAAQTEAVNTELARLKQVNAKLAKENKLLKNPAKNKES